MACWVVRFSVFGGRFIQFLCWNVCWLAGFWMLVLKAFFILEQEKVIIFSVQNSDLGGPVPPSWHLCRPFWHIGGTRASREQQEGHMGVWNRSFNDFGMIFVPHFDSFAGTEGQKYGFAFGFVSIWLLAPNLNPKSGHPLGIWKLGFRKESLQKNTSRRIQIVADFGVFFTYFDFYGFGIKFDDFWCLGNSLEISWFPMATQVCCGNWSRERMGANTSFLRPTN